MDYKSVMSTRRKICKLGKIDLHLTVCIMWTYVKMEAGSGMHLFQSANAFKNILRIKVQFKFLYAVR